MAAIRWADESRITVGKSETTSAAARRSGAVDGFPGQFLLEGTVELEDSRTVEVRSGVRRSDAPASLEFSIDGDEDSAYITVIRQASGALTFHAPERTESRRRTARSRSEVTTFHFRCPCHFAPQESGRRGLIFKAVKVFVLKVVSKAVERITEWVIPKLASAWESRAWQNKGLSEGWHRVTAETLRNGTLQPVNLKRNRPDGRALILLHGTFSDAAQAFGSLGEEFFDSVRARYADNVYAFNHFTVSRTPEENVTELLKGLPTGTLQADVMTHSRGGLVLRNLVERRDVFGSLADRLSVDRVVLVAAPNEGTPLATPNRWQETVGVFANLLELFPDNPFTTAAEFISESIVWIAKRATGDLPGIASMDQHGGMIQDLQSPPGPDLEQYYALVANYHPEESIWSRLTDAGVDSFFGMANDLVVPSEGGWRIDAADQLAGDRIGCFGAGGNLTAATNVHHGNFFAQPETVRFLSSVLLNGTIGTEAVDTSRPLPDRRFRRTAGKRIESAALPTSETSGRAVKATVASPPDTRDVDAILLQQQEAHHSALNLVILPPPDGETAASILATYANARVLETFPTRGGEAGKRWHSIIKFHIGIDQYINGQAGAELPTDADVLETGAKMFETLFPGDVQRIYDVARSSHQGDRLPVILTSMIPWVAEKPWEFAYDAARDTFLATEEIHFIRNVLTAIPAEHVEPSDGPLRILVVVAQPVGAGNLSSDQEIAVIRRSFAPLTASGLVEVDVLPKATPGRLHSSIGTGKFDVVHCICHGEYDEDAKRGYLLFETEHGSAHRIDERVVREILCQRGIRLVFLNACETGRGSNAGFNSGVAQALVAGGMPAVVANQYPVLDVSATAFSQHFYWCIAQGFSIGEAAREARISVRYGRRSEPIDWAVPVVYARHSETRLCCRRPAKAADFATSVTPLSFQPRTVRRSGTAAHRIGVWDINYSFPELESTLAALNRLQCRFEFEVVSLALPLSSRISLEDYDEPFLYADAVAERLATTPYELGLDFLCCVTHEPMAGLSAGSEEDEDAEYTVNLYGWATEDSTVALFSTAGLEIPPTGTQPARALTSALVYSLASRLGSLDVHEDGSRTCPMYYNEERDIDLIVGQHAFDAACQRALRQQIPDEFPALDAMLKAFSDHV